jgi:phosphohistidine phosphatase
MMCYLLRHGIAADPAEWRGSDFERPLTDEGRKRMAREAKAIADLSLELDVIITSPLVRAKQTAEYVADALKMSKHLVEDVRVGLGFSVARLESILEDHRDATAVMFVGHEPSMSEVTSDLIGGARIQFKKGSIACIELSNESSSLAGELVWLASPKVLIKGKS